MKFEFNESAKPAEKLNSLITIFEALQEQISGLATELDSEMLEEAEGDLDILVDLLVDTLEENGWEVK